MEKKLSAWCKNAKIEMIYRDLKTTTLAKELDMNRSYVSSILNGRVYSAPAVKKISDYLGIADSDTTTVSWSTRSERVIGAERAVIMYRCFWRMKLRITTFATR